MLTTGQTASALLLATGGALLVPSLAAPQGHHQGAPPAKDPATLFAASCSSCHLPPDPDHETDRAWLNQVRDTA